MKKHKFNHMLALATTMALVSGSQTVYAQQAAAEVEEITVTGYRATVLNSIDTKRQSDVVADVVDASAVGSLPQVSIADALGRIPGVTTVRDSGQSSQLNIRGMNGDFIQTTLNGREQATTSSYTESLRWMSFDQYPAELISQAAVYKSPKASHIEGGVAAVVELKTVNPLEAQKEHNFNAGVRLSHNDDATGDTGGERYSLSYQGKFLDDTFGVALGYSSLTQPNNFDGSRAAADGQIGYASANSDFARAYQFQTGYGDDQRDAFMLTAVFQPSDVFKAQLDYFKSEFESEDKRHGVTVGGLSNATATNGVISIGNPKTTGDSSPWIEARTEDQSTNADSDSLGLNLEFNLTDTTTLTLDYTDSKGDKTRKDRLVSMHAYQFGTATGNLNGASVTGATWEELAGQTISITENGEKTPTISFNNPDLLTSSNMRLSRYEEYPHVYTDEVESFKADLKQELEMPLIKSVEAGVRVSERVFDSRRGTFLYGARDGQFRYVDGNGDWQSYCADNITEPFLECQPQEIDGFVSVGSVDGAPDHFVVNMQGLADELFGPGNYQGKQIFSRDWTFVESGALEEKTDAFYLMANLETTLGSVPVTGNIGVRYVKSDVKSKGVQNVGDGNGVSITDDVGVTKTNYKYVEYGPEFSDTLPSLNLNFELSDNDVLRFAAAKVMGRPPAGQLKGGAGSWNGGDRGPNQYNVWTKGSPYLDPFRANQFDLSYEHYFDNGGAITVAGFWKDIESLVENISYNPEIQRDANGNPVLDGNGDVIVITDTLPIFQANGLEIPAGMEAGTYQTAVNNEKGGYIRGLELAGTYTFDSLPGIFSGLGTTASYSFTQSEMEITGGSLFTDKLSLPGLSENVWSLTAFWDIGQFSTNLNMRYRDEYVLNMPVPGSSTPVLGQAYTTMDYQASYAFDNGVDVVFEITNLTDEPVVLSYGQDNRLGEYKTFGRQYYVGVNYKF
jgi:iron complex outermembrane receptor protein